MLNRRSVIAAGWVASWLPASGRAALAVGDLAPDFTTSAALAGQSFEFSLRTALRQGPVVLYFFPAAFSEGRSLEARAFAEAIEQFQGLGAQVIGMSGDDLETLRRFSVKMCNGRFAVASDAGQAVMKAYDALLPFRADYAARVSYLITPESRIAFVYNNLNPARHVERTLAALREWRTTQGGTTR